VGRGRLPSDRGARVLNGRSDSEPRAIGGLLRTFTGACARALPTTLINERFHTAGSCPGNYLEVRDADGQLWLVFEPVAFVASQAYCQEHRNQAPR
jgi:hypothetical protein